MQLVTRLEAVEGKISRCGPSREDFVQLISELAKLNSNVQALTEVMVSNLKQTQNTVQPDAKVDRDKFSEANTLDRTTEQFHIAGSHSEREAAKRNRCYKQTRPVSLANEVIRPQNPLHLVFIGGPPPPINMSTSSADVDAANADDGAGGSTSPESDCALISPPAKAIVSALKKKTTLNARGKAIAKDRALGNVNELTISPSIKVS